MSLYFLRHGNLIKIGFSSNLGARVQSIISSIPGKVDFLGHMPGDRDVEAHFHSRFAAHRFSGEWFQACPELEATIAALGIPEQPAPEVYPKVKARRSDATDAWSETRDRVRFAAATRWPMATNRERIVLVSEQLGWTHRRARALMNNDAGCTLRQVEAEAVEAWLKPDGQSLAAWIAPEITGGDE